MIKIVYNANEKINTRFNKDKEGKLELPKIQLSKSFLRKHQINTKHVFIKFGNWSQRFMIMTNNHLSLNEIGLSKNLLPYKIPESMHLNIKVNMNVIHIGPYIACIVKDKFQQITKNTLEIYKNRFKLDEDYGRFILICSSDSIDINNQLIKGYYYGTNKIKNSWIIDEFPYPDSFFKKIRIPQEKEISLKDATGNKLFNTNFFNKFELWEACLDEQVNQFLPETKFYKSFNDLVQMIPKYETIYMKPIKGLKGIGIFVLKKEKDGILLLNNNKEKKMFHSIHKLGQYLDQILLNKAYIIQQGVPTVYKNKQFDFRLYFQKNTQLEWVCQGIIGRVAQEDSIVTNLQHLAHITSGEKTIKIVYKMRDSEAKKVMKDAVTACMKVCETIDKRLGHFGDVAIDVIIDHHFKPWILEVNNLYGKKSLHLLQENELLNTIHITPIEYASVLAGFK
ncbi:YheC/YheD family endospore coat-associated protein [Metabacillus schmidteae]|uniref:YheC/YheD family endospore coat-associated protein n=1 Tax=Metabacillus schmidteae TaxID=2730405 RepID=UPI00158CBF94|nr:YheC/YheD family protein [Metabacillus schmidteae]